MSKLADTFLVPVPDKTIIRSSSGKSVSVNRSPIEEVDVALIETLEFEPVGEVVIIFLPST